MGRQSSRLALATGSSDRWYRGCLGPVPRHFRRTVPRLPERRTRPHRPRNYQNDLAPHRPIHSRLRTTGSRSRIHAGRCAYQPILRARIGPQHRERCLQTIPQWRLPSLKEKSHQQHRLPESHYANIREKRQQSNGEIRPRPKTTMKQSESLQRIQFLKCSPTPQQLNGPDGPKPRKGLQTRWTVHANALMCWVPTICERETKSWGFAGGGALLDRKHGKGSCLIGRSGHTGPATAEKGL